MLLLSIYAPVSNPLDQVIRNYGRCWHLDNWKPGILHENHSSCKALLGNSYIEFLLCYHRSPIQCLDYHSCGWTPHRRICFFMINKCKSIVLKRSLIVNQVILNKYLRGKRFHLYKCWVLVKIFDFFILSYWNKVQSLNYGNKRQTDKYMFLLHMIYWTVTSKWYLKKNWNIFYIQNK